MRAAGHRRFRETELKGERPRSCPCLASRSPQHSDIKGAIGHHACVTLLDMCQLLLGGIIAFRSVDRYPGYDEAICGIADTDERLGCLFGKGIKVKPVSKCPMVAGAGMDRPVAVATGSNEILVVACPGSARRGMCSGEPALGQGR